MMPYRTAVFALSGVAPDLDNYDNDLPDGQSASESNG